MRYNTIIAVCIAVVFAGVSVLYSQQWSSISGKGVYVNNNSYRASIGLIASAAMDSAKLYLRSDSSNAAWPILKCVYGGTGATKGTRFIILGNGYVGIGTTNPSDRLTVGGGSIRGVINIDGGTANVPALALSDTRINGKSWNLYSGATALGDFSIFDATQNSHPFVIKQATGNVGIGTANPGTYKLAVEGKIGAREIVVTTNAWADNVLKEDYKLKKLEDVEAYIKKNGCLPGIQTEKEVKLNGVALGELQVKLLSKIEELTLHLIAQEKRIKQLEKTNEALLKKVNVTK